jgi:protein O-GlcNAc transferase
MSAQTLHRQGRTSEAEKLYRKLLAKSPRNHHVLTAYAVLLGETGRVEESSLYFQRAVDIEPNPRTLTNLGVAHKLLGKLDTAADAFGRVLKLAPDFPEARINLASVLMAAGLHKEALALLEEHAQRGPDSARLRSALALALLNLKRPDEALVHARRAVELQPTVASEHVVLGDALDACGHKSEAIASCRRAVELDPSDHSAHSVLIFVMLSSPEYGPKEHFQEARAWAKRHAEPLKKHIRPPTNDRSPERPLRVGYVSSDFRVHAIQQFLVPLLKHHDQSAFEIFLYSSVPNPDEATTWYRDFAGGRFRDIRHLDDFAAAELVRSDQVDILVDLALHSSWNRLRLFACRPAPVQISWLGYMGTTGLDSMDYRITDPYLDPPGTDLGVYSETCLHLPETVWCYAPLCDEPLVNPLPALEAGAVTFGCQNSFRKLHPGVFALWARVLRRVPDSRLFIHVEEHAQEGVRQVFAREGVDPERLEFGGRVSRSEYLRRYQRIDIGLDTFPFGGGTTTLDAAWMGVPVVTLSGPTAQQRAGSCIAMNLGLPELVANSEDAFVDAAESLASDLARLSTLRAQLRPRLETSALADAPRFARHLEAAFRAAWGRYCAGSPS